jgi:hypothetical protein
MTLASQIECRVPGDYVFLKANLTGRLNAAIEGINFKRDEFPARADGYTAEPAAVKWQCVQVGYAFP